MPRDLTGTVIAVLFFKLLIASWDFESSSALRAADFGFRFKEKCFTGGGWRKTHTYKLAFQETCQALPFWKYIRAPLHS